VALLEDGCWINDAVLAFILEVVAAGVSSAHQALTAFLNPALVHLSRLVSVEELSAILEPLALSSRGVIVCPINDSVLDEAGSGTHWSLAVLTREGGARELWLLDSMGGSNSRAAASVASRIATVAGWDVQEVHELDVPQQVDGCDCGLYVAAFAEALTHVMAEGTLERQALARRCEALVSCLGRHPGREMRRRWRAEIRRLTEQA